jgi:hypothetical protein
MGHAAVLGDQRETLGAHAHAARHQVQFQAQRLGEGGRAVGQHDDAVADLLALAPGGHHEGIVHRHAHHAVHALGLQGGNILNESRQMLGAAGRREGAWHGEQHHLLAFEDIVGRDLLGAVGGALHEFHRRDGVAYLDGHRDSRPRVSSGGQSARYCVGGRPIRPQCQTPSRRRGRSHDATGCRGRLRRTRTPPR